MGGREGGREGVRGGRSEGGKEGRGQGREGSKVRKGSSMALPHHTGRK